VEFLPILERGPGRIVINNFPMAQASSAVNSPASESGSSSLRATLAFHLSEKPLQPGLVCARDPS
jgi:hypothetical protein